MSARQLVPANRGNQQVDLPMADYREELTSVQFSPYAHRGQLARFEIVLKSKSGPPPSLLAYDFVLTLLGNSWGIIGARAACTRRRCYRE
jgi:hypothetical protein